MNRFIVFLIFVIYSYCAGAQKIYYARYETKTITTLDYDGSIVGCYDPSTCKDSLICRIKNFYIQDIGICPNGGIYACGFVWDTIFPAFYDNVLAKLNLQDSSYTIVADFGIFSETTSSCVCGADDIVYFGRGEIWAYNTNTGLVDSLGNIFPYTLAGDLTFHEGRLIGCEFGNSIIELNLNDLSNSQILFSYPLPRSAIGIATYVESCDSSVTYLSYTDDEAAPNPGALNQLYKVDFDAQTITYVCDMPRTVVGLACATEAIAQDCNLHLDLDKNNSSLATGKSYQTLLWCDGPVAVGDIDAEIRSGNRIDSVSIRLLAPVPDGIAEYLLSTGISPLLDVSGQQSQHLTLFRTAVAAADAGVVSDAFTTALRNIQLHNTSILKTPGTRTLEVIAYAEDNRRDTAFSFLTIPDVVVMISGDHFLCPTDTIDLSAGQFQSYLWSDGDTSGSISITEGGVYTITVTDAKGCKGTADYVVDEPEPVTSEWKITPPLCYNSQDGIAEALVVNGGWPPFLFSINTGMTTVVPVFLGLGSGTYNIHIVDNKGCNWNKEIYIENPDAIKLSIGNDLGILLGESVEIEPEITPVDDYEYFWSPPEGLSCTYCSHAIAAPVENTVYKLQILNNNGCAASDSILIRITVPDGNIYAPNVFSPADDGRNTTFTLFGDAALVEETEWLRIYDRWGSLVYEGKHLQPDNPNDGWDGSCRGKSSSSGIYFWQASIRFMNGNVVLKKGDVMLLR